MLLYSIDELLDDLANNLYWSEYRVTRLDATHAAATVTFGGNGYLYVGSANRNTNGTDIFDLSNLDAPLQRVPSPGSYGRSIGLLENLLEDEV